LHSFESILFAAGFVLLHVDPRSQTVFIAPSVVVFLLAACVEEPVVLSRNTQFGVTWNMGKVRCKVMLLVTLVPGTNHTL